MSALERFTGLKNALVERLPHQQNPQPNLVDAGLSNTPIEPLIAKVQDYLSIQVSDTQPEVLGEQPQDKTTEQIVFTQTSTRGSFSFDLSKVVTPHSVDPARVRKPISFLYPDGKNKTTSVVMLHGENAKLTPDRQRSHEEEDIYPRRKRT